MQHSAINESTLLMALNNYRRLKTSKLLLRQYNNVTLIFFLLSKKSNTKFYFRNFPYRIRFYYITFFLVYIMTKHGNKKVIKQLIKSGHNASEISEILNIKSLQFLIFQRERGDEENNPRKGRPKFVTVVGEETH